MAPALPHLSFGLIALLFSATFPDRSQGAPLRFQFNNDAFTRQIQERLLTSISSTPLPKTWQMNLSVEPRHPEFGSIKKYVAWTTCGWGTASNFDFEPRSTKLPDDPTLVLAAGYLKCQRIDVSFLEPRVSIVSYPTGYFGDYVYENLLIAERLEISDEDILRKIFLLAAKSTAQADDLEPFWFDDARMDSASDFRRETKFIPKLLIEFVGETAVRLEMDFKRQQILIQVGERWESYAFDSAGATALEATVTAEQSKRRQFGD